MKALTTSALFGLSATFAAAATQEVHTGVTRIPFHQPYSANQVATAAPLGYGGHPPVPREFIGDDTPHLHRICSRPAVLPPPSPLFPIGHGCEEPGLTKVKASPAAIESQFSACGGCFTKTHPIHSSCSKSTHASSEHTQSNSHSRPSSSLPDKPTHTRPPHSSITSVEKRQDGEASAIIVHLHTTSKSHHTSHAYFLVPPVEQGEDAEKRGYGAPSSIHGPGTPQPDCKVESCSKTTPKHHEPPQSTHTLTHSIHSHAHSSHPYSHSTRQHSHSIHSHTHTHTTHSHSHSIIAIEEREGSTTATTDKPMPAHPTHHPEQCWGGICPTIDPAMGLPGITHLPDPNRPYTGRPIAPWSVWSSILIPSTGPVTTSSLHSTSTISFTKSHPQNPFTTHSSHSGNVSSTLSLLTHLYTLPPHSTTYKTSTSAHSLNSTSTIYGLFFSGKLINTHGEPGFGHPCPISTIPAFFTGTSGFATAEFSIPTTPRIPDVFSSSSNSTSEAASSTHDFPNILPPPPHPTTFFTSKTTSRPGNFVTYTA